MYSIYSVQFSKTNFSPSHSSDLIILSSATNLVNNFFKIYLIKFKKLFFLVRTDVSQLMYMIIYRFSTFFDNIIILKRLYKVNTLFYFIYLTIPYMDTLG